MHKPNGPRGPSVEDAPVTRAPWEQDTLVPMFSTTKGVASMAIAVAHSRGLLAYDEPVARY